MALNGFPINGFVVLNASKTVLTGSGTFCEIEQEVEYRSTGSGTFASIEQEVIGVGSGTFASIEQRVINLTTVLSGCASISWDIRVGGTKIPINQLVGTIEVLRREDGAALAVFTKKPGAGSFNATADQGKTVTIDVIDGASVTRVYTGIVDIPTVNLLNESITYSCTDRRRELINNQLAPIKHTIGWYSSAIFGEAEDTFDEVTSRLETVPKAIDFDAFGVYHLTDLAPKATPDYTLGDGDIYNRSLSLEVTSRADIINKVNIEFDYRFPKLYNWSKFYSWLHPGYTTFCKVLVDGYTLTPREMVRQAVNSAGWSLAGDITFIPTPQPAFYRCGGAGDPVVAWSPNSMSASTSIALNPDGSQQVDANGNYIYEQTDKVITQIGNIYCLGASFYLSKRWAQTITENYTLTVQAPQSQTKYGVVEKNQRYGLESTYDTSIWESDEDTTHVYTTDTITNADTNRSAAQNTILTALNRAKTTILNSHRDNRIKFVRSIWPEIGLRHTVRLSLSELDAIGKVSGIKHSFDISTRESMTELELTFSQSEGSASDTALYVPSAPTYTPTQVTTNVTLGNHFGEDPTQASARNWTGMIGNKFTCSSIGGYSDCGRTQYDEYFVVDTPQVLGEARDNKILYNSATYNVAIPNNNLTITFDGKCRG